MKNPLVIGSVTAISFVTGVAAGSTVQTAIAPLSNGGLASHSTDRADATEPEQNRSHRVNLESTETVSINVQQLFKQAEQWKRASYFHAAYETLSAVPQTHPDFAKAQQQMQECANAILSRARDQHAQGSLTLAVRLLEAVPKETQAGRIAVNQLPTWRRQASVLALAEEQMSRKQWNSAAETLDRFKGDDLFKSRQVQQRLDQVRINLAYAWRGDRG